MIEVTPSGSACGAFVTGVDLSGEISTEDLNAIRTAWVEHHVLAFSDQQLDDDQLETLAQKFGVFAPEPYFEPIKPDGHVVSLCRRANEQAPVFAEAWHSDWSFQENPPIGTCLFSLTIPPVGGNTSFLNQQKALAEMPGELKAKLRGKKGIHSARVAYAPDGIHGEQEKDSDRSMKIKYSEDAYNTQAHPILTTHPESGNETINGCFGYIMGIEGMDDDEARSILLELYHWQNQEQFVYHHKWEENMFVIWDNRSVLHKANGGYDGYDRELHRVTIYGDPELYVR